MSKTKQNKTDTVLLRVTPEEKKLITEKAKACGMKMSEYIRVIIFSHNVIINVEKIK